MIPNFIISGNITAVTKTRKRKRGKRKIFSAICGKNSQKNHNFPQSQNAEFPHAETRKAEFLDGKFFLCGKIKKKTFSALTKTRIFFIK